MMNRSKTVVQRSFVDAASILEPVRFWAYTFDIALK